MRRRAAWGEGSPPPGACRRCARVANLSFGPPRPVSRPEDEPMRDRDDRIRRDDPDNAPRRRRDREEDDRIRDDYDDRRPARRPAPR